MIVPTAIDWDGDHDLDLIVGDEDGRVALVENTGKLQDQIPQFPPSSLLPAGSGIHQVRSLGNTVCLRLGP